ncbi:hypothetical protein ACO3VM_07295 [Methanocaldococcus sp. 10A]
MTEIIKLSKTVVLKSRPLTRTKIKIIENTIEVYKEILTIALDFGLRNKIKGHIKIRKGIYEEIKKQISEITYSLHLHRLTRLIHKNKKLYICKKER